MEQVLEVGNPLRSRAALSLRTSVGVLVLFIAFAAITTQDKAIRAQTPWQDDPYDAAVTLSMSCVPVVLALVLLRLLLCRRDQPLPVVRVRGLLQASAFGLVLVAATGVVDLVAWQTGARSGDWGLGTPWLVLTVTGLVVASATALLLGWRVARSLPATETDDWSADLVPLGDLAASRFRALLAWVPGAARWAERHLLSGRRGVRRHPVAWSVLLAEAGAAVIVAGLWLGEGTPLWLIGPLGALVCGSGFVWVVVLANRTLHLTRVEPGRPILRTTWLAAALGLDLAFSLRDQAWSALGLGGSVPTLTDIYLVMACGAVAGVLAGGLVQLVRRLDIW